MVATVVMAVTAVTKDRLVDSEEGMEAMAMDSKALAVVRAATRKVGRRTAMANRAVVDTNNRVGAATSSRVAAAAVVVAMVVAVEAHVSTP
jgi:hypothetical protein